ncbi:MAG: hypothetical protein ACI8X5_000649 [Planctomycetota bacterium]|jgi:hypothetical protein
MGVPGFVRDVVLEAGCTIGLGAFHATSFVNSRAAIKVEHRRAGSNG